MKEKLLKHYTKLLEKKYGRKLASFVFENKKGKKTVVDEESLIWDLLCIQEDEGGKEVSLNSDEKTKITWVKEDVLVKEM